MQRPANRYTPSQRPYEGRASRTCVNPLRTGAPAPCLAISLIAAAGLSLAGCAATADTFPLNDQAQAMGPLHINFTRPGLDFASVTATLADGEVLKGTVHPAFNESLGGGLRLWSSWLRNCYGSWYVWW